MHTNSAYVEEINGTSFSLIAEEFGTPTYVYDKTRIRTNYIHALRTFQKHIPNFQLFYAIKACNNLNIARILTAEGAGIDAASVHEIQLARALGVAGENILFTGNNLSDGDIRSALQTGAIFNADAISVLSRAIELGPPEIVSCRINPGEILGDYHTLLQFAGSQAKFGIHPDDAVDAYQLAKSAGISRFGIHMMPGSCTLEPDYFVEVSALLFDTIGSIKEELGINFEFIDLGGGLGIPYRDEEQPLNLEKTAKALAKVIASKSRQHRLSTIPRIIMEPARYFVADAGYIIGRVHHIKHSYDRKIIGTDISMNVLARPALYNSYHRTYVLGKMDDPMSPAGLCGQVCENTDLWIDSRQFPDTTAQGDLILVRDAGAYGYCMSYQYNGRLRAAEVLIEDDGTPVLIRRREDFGDMISQMILDPDLAALCEKLATTHDP